MRVLERGGDLQRERLEQRWCSARNAAERDDWTATTPSQSPYMNSGTPSHERMPSASPTVGSVAVEVVDPTRRSRCCITQPASAFARRPSSGGRTCRCERSKPSITSSDSRPARRCTNVTASASGIALHVSRATASTSSSSCSAREKRRAGRRQNFEIVHALLQLVPRPRQPREHEVDQQIRQRQQQEAERLIRIVEQHEHHADRHQRRLGDDARQRELGAGTARQLWPSSRRRMPWSV